MTLKEQLEERFRAAAAVQKVTVDGLDVFVRAITCAEKEAYMTASVEKLPNSIARFVSLILCDETGKRLYGDADVAALAGFPAKAMDDIWDAGLAFNHMGGRDTREKKTDADGAALAPDSPGVPGAGRGLAESPANHATV